MAVLFFVSLEKISLVWIKFIQNVHLILLLVEYLIYCIE